MSEYRVEKCGGLTVYHPVGTQYPDLQQAVPAPNIALLEAEKKAEAHLRKYQPWLADWDSA